MPGTALELPHRVNRTSHKVSTPAGVPDRHRKAVNARMMAVILLGLTGVTTPGKISAPSTSAVIAAAPSSSESTPPERSNASNAIGGQEPSRLLLVGAALIAIAAAVRRGDADGARG
jgi:hypothetical protein